MERMRDFAENVTIHGIFRILNSKKTGVRAFWLVLFLGSASYLTYQVAEIFKSFLNYSIITKVEKRNQKPLRFPAITFCPTMYMDFQNLTTADIVNETRLKEIVKQADRGKQLVLKYIFEGETYNYPEKINHWIIPGSTSLCYTFNPKGDLAQHRAGALNRLNILLFINSSEAKADNSLANGPNSLANGPNSLANGIRISIHAPAVFPFPRVDGIGISPGFSSTIALKKRTTFRKEHPYTSNCTQGNNEHRIFPGKYSVVNCDYSCMEEKVINICGWPSHQTAAYMPRKRKLRLYDNFNASSNLKCLQRKEVVQNLLTTECNCPIPCHETTYKKTLSLLKWPNDNEYDVWIYFEEMLNEIVTELPEWTFTKLISDIGGQTGVWLGASVLSIVELLMLMASTPVYLLRNKNKLKVSSPGQT